MNRSRSRFLWVIIWGITILCSCTDHQTYRKKNYTKLEEIAESHVLWTGIAVSKDNRLFVNYPRWSPNIAFSVAEIMSSGDVKPFPDEVWNSWEPSTPPQDHFICVQSVYVDKDNDLWILDPAFSIYAGSVIDGGPKLIQIDLNTNQVIKMIYFNAHIAPARSYLNDVRVDTQSDYAYITDSGLGAIIVVDLTTGKSRRLLTRHPSTKSENITLTIEGKSWLQPDGTSPEIHSDGLALDAKGKYLYYQALTGHNLYRIPTEYLHDPDFSEDRLGQFVEHVGESGASDGITFGPDGCIYLTSLEHNAIRRWTRDNKLEMVFHDPRLKWPDSIAFDRESNLYITTSQIHLGNDITEPYRILKLIGE